MTLEEKLAEHTDHCADCIEVSDETRQEIEAVVEAADHFKNVNFRVASDGTFIYRLPEGYAIRDGKLIIGADDTPEERETADGYASSPWD